MVAEERESLFEKLEGIQEKDSDSKDWYNNDAAEHVAQLMHDTLMHQNDSVLARLWSSKQLEQSWIQNFFPVQYPHKVYLGHGLMKGWRSDMLMHMLGMLLTHAK